jgi:tetratricopeptide (TPR) repeat protein
VLGDGVAKNAIDYWVEQGNNLFEQGNYEEAINYYDKAINLKNHANSPITNEIATQCGYHLDASDRNNSNKVFNGICAEPIGDIKGGSNLDSKGVTISFDISNPNDLDMRISNIYINVSDYSNINNTNVIENFGVKRSRGYLCNIKPIIGSYECMKKSKDYDFIDLAPGELEHIVIDINTYVPGIYHIKIDLDYAIGSETGKITEGYELIGFF